MAALNRHVHDEHVAEEPTIYRATEEGAFAAWFRERLETGDVAFIAEADGEPVGFVVVRVVEQPGHLFVHPRRFLIVDQLAVAAPARRRGFARALMRAAERHARDHGIDAVELDVRAAQAGAVAFYHALGYAPLKLRLQRRLG